MNLKCFSFFFAGFVLSVLLVSQALYAEPADLSEDTSQGWNPAQMMAWSEAQLKYARAVKQYGEGSPEATDAEVMMNTLGRKLGIKATTPEVPQQAAIPPLVPEAEPETDATEKPPIESPALNAPAPNQLDDVTTEPSVATSTTTETQ